MMPRRRLQRHREAEGSEVTAAVQASSAACSFESFKNLRYFLVFLPAPGDQTLAEAQLAEDVHHRLHGRVVGDGEGAEVQDASQLQRLRVAGRQLRRVLGEVNDRAAHHAVLLLTGVFCSWTRGKVAVNGSNVNQKKPGDM